MEDRDRRFAGRLRRGLVVGLALGAGLGAALGLVAGGIAFGWGSAGMWGTTVGGALAGLLIGAFEGGMSRLESPQPGREPSEVRRPVSDVPELTSEEGEPPAAARDDQR